MERPRRTTHDQDKHWSDRARFFEFWVSNGLRPALETVAAVRLTRVKNTQRRPTKRCQRIPLPQDLYQTAPASSGLRDSGRHRLETERSRADAQAQVAGELRVLAADSCERVLDAALHVHTRALACGAAAPFLATEAERCGQVLRDSLDLLARAIGPVGIAERLRRLLLIAQKLASEVMNGTERGSFLKNENRP